MLVLKDYFLMLIVFVFSPSGNFFTVTLGKFLPPQETACTKKVKKAEQKIQKGICFIGCHVFHTSFFLFTDSQQEQRTAKQQMKRTKGGAA